MIRWYHRRSSAAGHPDFRRFDVHDEVRRLQRCINDLVSILALPAMWTGGEPARIVHTLVDALLRMLQLDLVYVRLFDPLDDGSFEVLRVAAASLPMLPADAIRDALRAWLGRDPASWPPTLHHRLDNGDLSI